MTPPLLRHLRHGIWATHGGLTLGLAWLIAGDGRTARVLLAAAAVLPLLLAWPGLLRGRAYTAAWASLLVAFYCALLLAEAYMQPAHKGALLVLATLAALDFAALTLFAKVQARAARAG